MVQQINCVRKKKDGEIVEGSDDDIRANSYVAAFQREYNEGRTELEDYRFSVQRSDCVPIEQTYLQRFCFPLSWPSSYGIRVSSASLHCAVGYLPSFDRAAEAPGLRPIFGFNTD